MICLLLQSRVGLWSLCSQPKFAKKETNPFFTFGKISLLVADKMLNMCKFLYGNDSDSIPMSDMTTVQSVI